MNKLRRKFVGHRKYSTKSTENSEDRKNEANMKNLDPFDVQERQFDLVTKISSNSNYSVKSIPEDKNESNDFEDAREFRVNLQNQTGRINIIKKLQNNFERDINVLNSSTVLNPKQVKILQKTSNESEIVLASKDIISLIEKSAKQKLKVMELQLQNERLQSEKLTDFIKNHMQKIIEVDQNLRKELGDEVSSLIESSGKQKIKVMELQFENEQTQSNQLNKKIQDQTHKIEEYDKTIRKQRNQLQIEVKEKTQKLLKAERLSAIGELAARVAHDLRNPLSVIKASVELMKLGDQKGSSKFIEKQMGLIDRGISRMTHQIEDVLDFVRPIPLVLTKNSILNTIRSSAEKTNLSEKFTLVLPENDFEFYFDKEKIDVVFDNLLTNAMQAMIHGGKIVIKISKSDDYVLIHLQDSGPGIPKEILPKIFEPLITTKQTGTGLGLASAKSIIEQHLGTISVKNNPTTFTIKLPKSPKINS